MFLIVILSTCIISTVFSASVQQETDKKPQPCVCVPYFQCYEETGRVISTGEGLIDFRTTHDEPKKCSGDYDVCCILPTIKKVPTKREFPKGCGFNHKQDFPWTVALMQQTQKYPGSVPTSEYRCGASLINERAVITAAHCVQSDGNWTAKVQNKVYTVENIVTHPDYDSVTLKNDIAVVVLQEAVEMPDNEMRTICIPPPGTYFDQSKCMVNAWQGEDADLYWTNNPLGSTLKLPIVPRARCQKILRSTRLGIFFELHESFICAGGEKNQDTCRGDGGSPLVCPAAKQPGRYHQVGIVSWGIGCGAGGTPGVYVNVAMFRAWIDEIMTKNGLDVLSYRY